MSALLVGYARCSTDQQDLTAQRDALLGLGVEAERHPPRRGRRTGPGTAPSSRTGQAGDGSSLTTPRTRVTSAGDWAVSSSATRAGSTKTRAI